MAGVLDGIKVVSVELMEAVPAASVWMADWGADVIKIEPLTGEQYRGTRFTGGTSMMIDLGNGEVNFSFELVNRSKRGLAIDLKQDAGKEVLYELVKKADIFMSNYRYDSLQSLKMDYNTLKQFNPSLIYAFLSGYGTIGPDKDERGYDLSAAWARSGLMHLIGEPGCAPPKSRSGMMDRAVASHLVAGVLAALVHRYNTGEGQELEISLYQSAVWILSKDIQSALVGRPMPKDDRTKAQNPIWNSYCTRDDKWLWMAELISDPAWPAFCRAIERPEFETDPRFNNMQTRTENCEELIRILDEIFATRSRDEWKRIFKEHNCIWGPVQTPEEVVNDPQALVNDFFVELNHPAGPMKVVASPVKFTQNPAVVSGGAPQVGQNTEEILLEFGYEWEDIAKLSGQGVIL